MSSLVLDRVSVRYPGTTETEAALNEVSLELPADGLVVALGPSGCGKTTLLNVMAGFIQPTSGQITLDGAQVCGPSAERGVVFQDHALLPWLNVLENVAFALRLQGVSSKERQQRAAESLQLVGLAGYEYQQIWQLSGGQKQRVGLARALTANPRVLLLDEPFAALDPFTREQMQELLLQIWQQTGKQIFLITHDLEEAVFLASELILLSPRPGRIVQRQSLEFSCHYLQGASARQIKSEPDFIRVREQVLARIFADRADHTSQHKPVATRQVQAIPSVRQAIAELPASGAFEAAPLRYSRGAA
jgi:taurine transport system ATP-binding protein